MVGWWSGVGWGEVVTFWLVVVLVVDVAGGVGDGGCLMVLEVVVGALPVMRKVGRGPLAHEEMRTLSEPFFVPPTPRVVMPKG